MLRNRIVRGVAIAGLVCFAARGLVAAAKQAFDEMAGAFGCRRETAVEARARTLGAYAEGIERIRAAIPRDAEYLIVEGKPDDGAHFFVVYDLAPRRALYLGDATGSVGALRHHGPPERSPHWVVISYGSTDAPGLVSSDDFFARRQP